MENSNTKKKERLIMYTQNQNKSKKIYTLMRFLFLVAVVATIHM